MSRQRDFPTRVKLKAWDRCEDPDGVHLCECGCGLPIHPGDGPEYDHRVPAALGGQPTLENCVVMRRSCHAEKTGADQKTIARARRQRVLHANAKASASAPLPGARASKWKRALTSEGARWVRR